MKGGTARESILVRVGAPSLFRVSGHVLRLDQRPLAGIRVLADATHGAFTDNDGSYTIAGLVAGSYNLSATEPVVGTPSFIHPFFSNPLRLGPSVINMDFIVGTSAPPVTLVATGSVWKYLDNGTDQGTAWIAPGFDDSAWAAGPAQLGYGDGDEATVISYGPNANAKYTTTYFRYAFNVSDATALTNPIVNLIRDDGAIVYLNGTEVFRSNMPNGPVTYTTFAATVAADDGKTIFSSAVPAGVLVTGNNVIAVELHQADLTSSDTSFELSLTAQNAASQPQGAVVYLTSPESGAVFTGPADVTFSAVALSTSTSVTNVEFYDGITKVGESATAPFTFFWSGVPEGKHSLTARAKMASGQTIGSGSVIISVVAPPEPMVNLTSPAEGATFDTSGTVSLAAQVVVGSGLGVVKVEFFADGGKLGEDSVAPYSLIWTNPPVGPHEIAAIATDTVGG